MAAERNNHGESLPLTVMRRIDDVCQRFEAAWQSGKSPRPEDFLAGRSGAEGEALLRELLRVDLDYRRERGIMPAVGEYLPRFPGHEVLVREEVENRVAKYPPQNSPKANAESGSPMQVTLRVVAGPHTGRSFTLTGHDTFIVGRSSRAHLRLTSGRKADRRISRVHFLIEVNPPLCRVYDLGSRNHTYVNGKRVRMADVTDGDEIRAGRTTALRVEITDEEAGPPPPWEAVFEPVSKLVELPRDLRKLTPGRRRKGVCLCCPAAVPETGEVFCRGCVQTARRLPQPVPGYLLVAEIGRGAMGVVHLARRETDGDAVAVKTITPAGACVPKAVDRFLREANILRQLRHRHIVPFYDMGEADGLLYFVMEYVAGPSAAALLQRSGPMPIRSAVRLTNELLLALTYAHKRGFVHRDIKPLNLLIEETERKRFLKVADFGLARVYEASRLSGLTMQNEMGGTFGFMAPEQITNFRNVKPAADQYSAAATLYNLLSGRRVYEEGNLSRLLEMMDTKDPVPLRTHRPEVPEVLAGIIHRALAREPSERFPDVEHFRQALIPFGE